MRSRGRGNVSKEGRIRGNFHPMMDGDRDRDPHWNTGLSPQVPNEEQRRKNKKEEVRSARGSFIH